MISKINKILIGIVTGLLLVFAFNIKVQAATANVSVSSANGTKGQEVSVNVSVSGDETITNSQIGISYDTKKLEYISGDSNSGVAGLIIKTIDEDIPVGQTKTIELKFRAKETGDTVVSVASNTRIYKLNADSTKAEATKNASNGTITITESSNKSNDNHLSGMVITAVSKSGENKTVTLTPSFSPDVYEYKLDLASNVEKLVVATTLSDGNATAKVSGTRIDPGNNKTTITVTAQDKSVATYTIYSTKTTEADSVSGDNTPSEETTADFDRSPKKIKSLGKYIIQDFSLITIPEGFEESTATYNGETVAALKGLYKPMTLICLADDAQGSNIGIFIYNEVTGEFNKMVNINSIQKIYTIIPTDASYSGPEGYTATELNINGDVVPAWIKSADSQFYIVYAMNWDGEASLYCFDTKELTMQRFIEGNKSENTSDIPNEDNQEYQALKKKYNDVQKEYKDDHSKKNKMIIGLVILVVCFFVILVFMVYKSRKNLLFKNTDSDLDDSDETGSDTDNLQADNKNSNNSNRNAIKENNLSQIDEEKSVKRELNLDLAEQVNELKPKNLAKNVQEVMDMENESNLELDGPMDKIDKALDGNNGINTENKKDMPTENKINKSNQEKIADQEKLINMEDDEPFEIEFVDLEDSDQKEKN